MTWRQRLKRRLLWAGALGGLLLLLTAVSLLRVALWTKREANLLTSSLRARASAATH